MKKRYLKSIEDIEALRNTDTKIYKDNTTGYHKFVHGVLCFFNTDSAYAFYNVTMDFNQVESKLYIEVEDEPSEDLVGRLGWFWDTNEKDSTIGILYMIRENSNYPYVRSGTAFCFAHFRPLTPEEVEKYTGYKGLFGTSMSLADDKMQANGLANDKK